MAEDAVSVILNIFFLTDASLGFTDCSCGPDYLCTGNNCRGRSFFTSVCVCGGGRCWGGGGDRPASLGLTEPHCSWVRCTSV